MLIPTAQIELYIGLGFRLVDEPACGLARISAGVVCRVPKNEKARQRAGLARAWADPAKRETQAMLTRERMANWRAERLQAAATALQQMPRGEREAALAGLASAARGGAR